MEKASSTPKRTVAQTREKKLKDQRWQRKRLELLEAAGWKCQRRQCQNLNDKPTLHVHHRAYFRNTDPWDYPDFCYLVVCPDCHIIEQDEMEKTALTVAQFPMLNKFCEFISDYERHYVEAFLEVALACVSGHPDDLKGYINILNVIQERRNYAYAKGWTEHKLEQDEN